MTSQFSVINKILNNKDMSLVNLNNLDDRYFFNYKSEFSFIKNHYDLYKCVPDKITFAATFPEFDFVEITEPDSFLLEQLYKDYNTSYLASRFNTIKKMLENDKTDEAIQYFINSTENLHTGKVMTCTDLLKDTSRYDRYVDRIADHDRAYLTTGFPQLDQLIGGIDRTNENMVVIARTGQGKTQILLKMASVAAMQGLTVGIYEGEMTADKVGYRIDTFIGHIKNTSLNRGDAFIQKQYKTYIDSLAIANYGAIKVFTPTDVPTGEVTVDTLKTFIEKEKLDILFVDQYDLLDDKRGAKVEYERIANIARDIKLLQVEKQIPIIAVSQMNRTKNEDKEGNKTQDTTQVAGSDKIPRYATTIIALDQKMDETAKQVRLTLNIIKARDGGDHNKLVYGVNFNTGEFIYIPSENDKITTQEDLEEINNRYSVDNFSEDYI